MKEELDRLLPGFRWIFNKRWQGIEKSQRGSFRAAEGLAWVIRYERACPVARLGTKRAGGAHLESQWLEVRTSHLADLPEAMAVNLAALGARLSSMVSK